MKSRSLLLTAPGTLAWSEEALSAPGPGEVALETRTGAMSLGSELPLYLGTAQRSAAPRYPYMTGYELEPLTLSPYFHERELALVGSSDGWDYPRHAAWFFEVLGEGGGALEALFDLHITANELPATFRRLAGSPHEAIKVLVRYRG